MKFHILNILYIVPLEARHVQIVRNNKKVNVVNTLRVHEHYMLAVDWGVCFILKLLHAGNDVFNNSIAIGLG